MRNISEIAKDLQGQKMFQIMAASKELEKKGKVKFTRQTLQDVGDKLRRVNGDDVLAKRMIALCRGRVSRPIVIEGIRNPGEIEFLKKNSNFQPDAKVEKKEQTQHNLF